MTRIIQTGAAINRQGRPGAKLTTFIPVRIKRHGGRKVVIPAAAGDKMPEHDAPILTALSKAFHWQRLLDEGIASSGSDIARREGLNQSTVNELLRLAWLSPVLVRGILDGRQPKTLSINWLKNNLPPSDWDEQHRLFDGFDA